MQKVLFICSRNRRRSPTAETIFSGYVDLEVSSAGLAPDAENILTPEMLEDADIIFVMESKQRKLLRQRFPDALKNKRVLCLDIPDNYEYMDEELIALLKSKIGQHLSLARSIT